MGGRYRSQAGVRATEDGMPAIMAMREEESCVPIAHAKCWVCQVTTAAGFPDSHFGAILRALPTGAASIQNES